MEASLGHFMAALYADDEAGAVALLEHDATLAGAAFHGGPALVCAARRGLNAVCDALLALGADVNQKGADFYPLENAIHTDNYDLASAFCGTARTRTWGVPCSRH